MQFPILISVWRTALFSINAETKAFIKNMVDMKFPLYYDKFNKILENSGGDYVAGKKLTHADFWLASFVNVWDGPTTDDMFFPIMPFNLPVPTASEYKENLSANYPKLRAHKERIMNIPQIKAWIQIRPKSAA
jgi:glutathione S-transferase